MVDDTRSWPGREAPKVESVISLEDALYAIKVATGCTEQVGGTHYDMPIQPTTYCELNKLSHLESYVVKYISRYKHKGEELDLDKAIDCIKKLKRLHYGQKA